MMRSVLKILLAVGMTATMVMAQSSSSNTQSTTTTQDDTQNNPGTMQKAGSATKAAAKSAGAATMKGGAIAGDKLRNKLDLNRASKEDLMKLEGVGDATSDKIIAGRPYTNKRQLLTRKIVSQSEYAKISDHIIAHESTAKPSAAASNADKQK